jgi:DNA-binding MarR family transcriptional regulator
VHRRAPSDDDVDYEDLLALRSGLRRFVRWSDQQAASVGLTPAQHQLLVAVRGHADPRGPTVGEVADHLLLRHHSAVGLVDRAVSADLIERTRDAHDRRMVRLQLTALGEDRLAALRDLHREELDRLVLTVPSASRGLLPHQPLHGLGTRP